MAAATIPQAGASRLFTRELRGLALARQRFEEIEHEGQGRFTVPGCSGGSYTVQLPILGAAESCTCPDFQEVGRHTGEPCKHIYAATVVRAKRQAAARRRQAERNAERMVFSPDQVAANLQRMGA